MIQSLTWPDWSWGSCSRGGQLKLSDWCHRMNRLSNHFWQLSMWVGKIARHQRWSPRFDGGCSISWNSWVMRYQMQSGWKRLQLTLMSNNGGLHRHRRRRGGWWQRILNWQHRRRSYYGFVVSFIRHLFLIKTLLLPLRTQINIRLTQI